MLSGRRGAPLASLPLLLEKEWIGSRCAEQHARRALEIDESGRGEAAVKLPRVAQGKDGASETSLLRGTSRSARHSSEASSGPPRLPEDDLFGPRPFQDSDGKRGPHAVTRGNDHSWFELHFADAVPKRLERDLL